jgi:hypothetical protein
MLKNIYYRFKNGLNLAAESFAMLWHHPVLLLYYLGLLALYVFVFVIAYNIIGHTGIASISNDFQTPNANLLADVIPQSGGLIYLSFLASICINIFLRTLLSFALIFHAHAFLTKKQRTISEIYILTKQKWATVLKWSLLVTAVTFIVQLLNFLPIDQKIITPIVSAAGTTWFIITFLVLPILALTKTNIMQSISISTYYCAKQGIKIMGGLFWMGLVYTILFISNLFISNYLIPAQLSEAFMDGSLFFINALFGTVLLLFKTKLFHQVQQAQKTTLNSILPDYSQF